MTIEIKTEQQAEAVREVQNALLKYDFAFQRETKNPLINEYASALSAWESGEQERKFAGIELTELELACAIYYSTIGLLWRNASISRQLKLPDDQCDAYIEWRKRKAGEVAGEVTREVNRFGKPLVPGCVVAGLSGLKHVLLSRNPKKDNEGHGLAWYSFGDRGTWTSNSWIGENQITRVFSWPEAQ